MNKIKSLLVRGSLFVVVSLSSLFLVTPVSAGGPIVYNQTNSFVPMNYCNSLRCNLQMWIPNSTRFYIKCWGDNSYASYGNYWTTRWFFGEEFSRGAWGYLNASFVYYQTWSPHC